MCVGRVLEQRVVSQRDKSPWAVFETQSEQHYRQEEEEEEEGMDKEKKKGKKEEILDVLVKRHLVIIGQVQRRQISRPVTIIWTCVTWKKKKKLKR